MNWINKALKRIGIKGEHAYLEAIEDVKKEFDKEIAELEKNVNMSLTYKISVLRDFKLKLFK